MSDIDPKISVSLIGAVLILATIVLLKTGIVSQSRPISRGTLAVIFLIASAISAAGMAIFTDRNPLFGFLVAYPVTYIVVALYGRFHSN